MRKLIPIFILFFVALLLQASPISTDTGDLRIEQRGFLPHSYTVKGDSETIYRGSVLEWNSGTNKVVTRLAASSATAPAFVGIARDGSTSATGHVQTYYDFYFKTGTTRTISGTPAIGAPVYVKTRQDYLLDNMYLLEDATALLTGTAEIAAGAGPTVTGTGAAFLSELNVGDSFYLTGESANALVIASIATDDSMVLTGTYGGTTTTQLAAYAIYESGLTTNSTETYNAVPYYNLVIGKIAEYNTTDSWVIHCSRDMPLATYTAVAIPNIATSVVFTFGAAENFQIDADATDHTGGFVQNINLGVNSASVDALRINADVGTALSGAETMQGIFLDVGGKAADAAGSFIHGFNTTMTHVSTSEADIVAYKALFDGTRDTDDTSIGFYLDGGTTVVNSTAAIFHGIEIDLITVVETDYTTAEFIGVLVDLPTTFQGTDIASAAEFTGDGITTRLVTGTAATAVYNLHAVCSADNTAIFIDSGTTNRAVDSDVININLDVEGNYSVDVFLATYDFETTGMAAADISRGVVIDFNEVVASADTSIFIGFDCLETGFATSRNDVVGFRAYFDGNHTGADTTIAFLSDISTGTMVLNTNTFTGLYVDGSAYTHTAGTAYAVAIDLTSAVTAGTQTAINVLTGPSTTVLDIDAATTNTTNSTLITADVDVTGVAFKFLNATIDVDTTGLTADALYGAFLDIDDEATSNDTSSVTGLYEIISAADGSRSDIYGFNLALDGVQTNADETYGVRITDTCTRGATANSNFFGYYASGDGATITDADWVGLHVTNIAAITAGSCTGVNLILDQDNANNAKVGIALSHDASGTNSTHSGDSISIQTVINADAANAILHNAQFIDIDLNGTTAARDTFAGNKIQFNADVALEISADTSILSLTVASHHDGLAADALNGNIMVWSGDMPNGTADANLDIYNATYSGTIGSGGAEGGIVNGYKVDMTAATANGSAIEIYAFHGDNTGFTDTSSSTRTFLYQVGTWDTGINLSDSTNTNDIILSNGGLIHNTSASLLTFTEATFNFIGNVTVNGAINYGTESGAKNAYIATPTPTITAYVNGMIIFFQAGVTSDAATTLKVGDGAVKDVATQSGAAIAAGDIVSTGFSMCIWDAGNDRWTLMNPATTTD